MKFNILSLNSVHHLVIIDYINIHIIISIIIIMSYYNNNDYEKYLCKISFKINTGISFRIFSSINRCEIFSKNGHILIE